MMVGHIQMVHTCSFLCPCHIDMTVHISAFYELGTTLSEAYMEFTSCPRMLHSQPARGGSLVGDPRGIRPAGTSR